MTAVAPDLWRFEIRSALLMSERDGTLDAARTVEVLAHPDSLPIRLEPAQESETVFALARAHRLTVYGAVHLGLAHRLAVPLATSDRACTTAAQAASVPLLGEA